MEANSRGVAVVTGASAGIGAAIARTLAAEGWTLVLGARRMERISDLAQELGASAVPLDVRNPESVRAFVSQVPRANLLVNNAGLAQGVDPIGSARDEDWVTMFETNVLGLVRMTRDLLPALEASGNGHIINIGSVAGFSAYPGGGGYTASKHAVNVITRTLRLELLGKPIRVTEIAPGLVETEFSEVRFGGDRERAARVYQGLEALSPHDVAECVAFAAGRPAHVNIDMMVVQPRDQATARDMNRRREPQA